MLCISKLWLISFDEYVEYFQPSYGDLGYNVYFSADAICYYWGTTEKSGWATRTPHVYLTYGWEIVAMDHWGEECSWGGFIKSSQINFDYADYNYDVRPAFQITIA